MGKKKQIKKLTKRLEAVEAHVGITPPTEETKQNGS